MLFLRIPIISLCIILLFNSTLLHANELAGHPSPYLALHGNDPVNWRDWSEDALSKARKEDKLVFVSVGYFACHWCHVMQRESFSSQAIAKTLNQSFISIKVDRELNPVLDERLMEFIQTTRGRGGWPLNVFLTPDGYPLTAITYVPPDSFARVLKNLQFRKRGQAQSTCNHFNSSSKIHNSTSPFNVDWIPAVCRSKMSGCSRGCFFADRRGRSGSVRGGCWDRPRSRQF